MTEQLEEPSWVDALARSYENPNVFVREVLGITPEKWQADAMDAIAKHDRVSIRSGHGIGKTALQSWLVWWFLCTRLRCKVPVSANSQDQLRDTIWPEIARWHRKMPEQLQAMFEVGKERVYRVTDPEGAFAVARTASKDNPEALQGFHEDNLLFLFDEASGIPDIVFEVGMGALSTAGAKVVMAGNPTRTNGFFFDTHHILRERWHTMHVSCCDVPRAQGHIEDIKLKFGEGSNAYRVRVLGEFPTADDDTVIPLEWITMAVNRDISHTDYYPVWGLDVARYGDDRSALAKRQGNKLLEPIMHWANQDTMVTAGKVKAEYELTNPDMRPSEILVDVIGVGGGVVDRLRELGLPCRGINVGEAASSRDNCSRLRDELWWKGREFFEAKNCSIPNDPALISELCTPTYTFTSTGKMVVERKEEMKKRGLRSPDLADAFLLTFASGLQRRISLHRKKKRRVSGWAS